MRVPIFVFLFCTAASCDGSLPTREQPAGDCVKDSDCSATGQACMANQCTPCTAHTDCQSLVCDTYGDLGGVGKCISPDNVIYVDSSDNNLPVCVSLTSQPTGSQALPFCDIASAKAKLATNQGKIIRVLASPDLYSVPHFDTTTGPVVLIGPGLFAAGKTVTLSGDLSESDPRTHIAAGASVVIDGFSAIWDGIVAGPNSKVTIRRTVMDYMMQGASFGDGSTVTLDRDTLAMDTIGLGFTNSTVSITNSFFMGNTVDSAMGIFSFSGGSGTFQFNTVALNKPGGPAATPLVSCAGASTVVFKNSIFAQNGVSKQLAQGCQTVPSSLLVGQGDSDANQIQQEPRFVDATNFDLRLTPQDPANIQFVIDKAVGVNATSDRYVDHDYYGNRRPSGAGYDIGAFEVVSP